MKQRKGRELPRPFSTLPTSSYLPRRKEMKAPKRPMNAKPRIINPIGTPEPVLAAAVKVGISRGAGGVKVGSRVGVNGTWNAATMVGSIVGVVGGVAVGGGSMIGRNPVVRETRGAYTQPTPPGTPG